MTKKLISLMLLFFMLVNISLTTVYSYSTSFVAKSASKLIVSNWINSAQLKSLVSNNYITTEWLRQLANISWENLQSLANDYATKKITEKQLIDKLTWKWLSRKDLQSFVNNWYIKSLWIKYLQKLWIVSWSTWLESNNNQEFNSWNFLENKWEWVYKINFQDITKSNAWMVYQTWTWENNFPKKFELINWINLNIKQIALNKKFERTDEIKQIAQNLDRTNVDYWEVSFKEPSIQILPDRIRLNTTTEFKFTDKKQLENIRKNFPVDNDMKEKLNDIWKSDFWNLDKSLKNDFIDDDAIANSFKWKVDLPETEEEMDEKAIQWLMKVCKEEIFPNNPWNCTYDKVKKEIEESEKILESTESIEVALILPDINSDTMSILSQRPEDVRISRDQIHSIFDSYLNIMQIANMEVEDDSWPIEIDVPENNPYDDPNFCSWNEECQQLLDDKNDRKTMTYRQELLNWFTLWKESSVVFSDRLRVWAFWYYKTLYSIRVEFYYSYWFWIRIPIVAEVETKPWLLDNFTQQNASYQVRSKVDTVDWDANYYRRVWLPASKVFDWKEFVFKVTAWIKYKIRVIWDFVDVEWDIKLLSLLAEYLWDELKELFNLSDNMLEYVIDNNGIDKSKDFVPPFDWDSIVNLFRWSKSFTVRDFWVASLLARLTVTVDFKWTIDASCEEVNSNWWCPSSTIRYRNSNWKPYETWVAQYNPEDSKEDQLWVYSNFWVMLDEFLYIPTLVFKLFLAWWVKVYIPARWNETFWTDDYQIFEFELPIEALWLWRHEWTTWSIDATKDNKIYATNPEIDIEDPEFVIWLQWNHKTRLSFNSNRWNSTFNQYNINVRANPNCSDEWTRRESPTLIWQTPYNEPISEKNFNIKARWCSVYWEWTRVFNRNIRLRNDAFDTNINIWDGLSITTLYKIWIRNEYLDEWNIIWRYNITTDWAVNNISCNSWEIYNPQEWIDIDYLWRQRLENDFQITLKAIWCNQNWQTIEWKWDTETFNVHNKSFDPFFEWYDGNHLRWFLRVNSYKYPEEWYTTDYVYTKDRTIPVCGEWNVAASRFNIDNTVNDSSMIAFEPWDTIMARTCIRRNWVLVFQSDVSSTTTNDSLINDEFNDIEERLEWVFDPDEMQNIRAWFGDILDNPNFVDWIMNWIDEGTFTRDWITWLARMMQWGDFLVEWLERLSTFMWWNKSQISNWFKTMMSNWNISKKWLNSLNQLISSWKLSNNSLIWLSNLVSNTMNMPNNYSSFNFNWWLDNEFKDNGIWDNFKSMKWPADSWTSDEYINEKLSEINACFVDTYDFHIDNIDEHISRFEDEKNATKDSDTIEMYNDAISKLYQIRSVVQDRYSFLNDY